MVNSTVENKMSTEKSMDRSFAWASIENIQKTTWHARCITSLYQTELFDEFLNHLEEVPMLKNIVLAAIVASAAACTAQTESNTASKQSKLSCEVSSDLKTLKLSGALEATINDGDVLIPGFESNQPEAMLYVQDGIKAQLTVSSKRLSASKGDQNYSATCK